METPDRVFVSFLKNGTLCDVHPVREDDEDVCYVSIDMACRHFETYCRRRMAAKESDAEIIQHNWPLWLEDFRASLKPEEEKPSNGTRKVIDFGKNCLAEVEFSDDSIRVVRAINGYGDIIKPEDIKVTDEDTYGIFKKTEVI